jgi:hypothetical protein
MDTRPQQEQMVGAYRVGDAYIWFAIHYLDSSTDYREYLPASGAALSMPLLAVGLIVLVVVGGLVLLSESMVLS